LEPEQANLRLQALGLPAIEARMWLGFAQPLLQQLLDLRNQDSGRLPLLALNGPVGAGKSSLGRALEALAPALGLQLVVASIDDLYLPWPERQRRLAGNPFGVTRVPPGSHDLELLLECLEGWRRSEFLCLPRFDKTLAQGQGDRSGWRRQPCNALLLEGWLMGCRAFGPGPLETALRTVDLSRPGPGGAPALSAIELEWLPFWDRQLEAYRPLWQACDGLWVLRPLHWSIPRRWRFQAEARQRRRGGGWLAPAALDPIVRSSLCSLPPLLYQDPLTADPQWVMASVVSAEPASSLALDGEPLLVSTGRTSTVTKLDQDAADKLWSPPVAVGATRPAGQDEPLAESASVRAEEDQVYPVNQPESRSADQLVSPSRTEDQPKRSASLPVDDRTSSADGAAEGTGDLRMTGPEGLAIENFSVGNLAVQRLAVLDGRRRVVTILRRRPQDSSSASSLIG